MSTPRAKPWEVSSGTSTAAVSGSTTQAPLGSDSEAPAAVPERPTSLTDPSSSSSYNYGQASSGYGSTGYGTGYGGSRYGSGLGGSMYGSGYGSSMYGGYGSGIGGYGSSMYGGYGSGMGGYGGYGSSMYGGYGGGMYGPNGMQGPGGIAEGTQATFQLIESIIGAVGGFAQMLEATYMATHSSFFTMVSLAEQFGNLKNTLGSLLGIFAIIKFAKKLLYKISGRTYNHGISAEDFAKFQNKQKKLEESLRKSPQGAKSRISFKPLLLFLAASIGFPYLLSKAIQKLNEQQQSQQQRRLQEQSGMAAGTRNPLDPKNLEFAKAIYEFNPENPNVEIELKPKELVAILSKLDPLGNESQWWKVRSRSGKVGYVPSNYLSIIERAPKQVEASSSDPVATKFVDEFQKQ
ncbi:hypothetical protein CLUG_01101 [Clavispora lusitaniae ATCC 42720]|uniref:Peroxisomal membrane protein PEX13 n=2 Tax=Clavispora lusitaniae TaxID=36911 RepID=C4XYS8_CLAL4|nr:uncharacterized protein CLUG_01101 [Clavispora lusitaniae ATCC 42720]EEQ36978.1 hypothetical protein CLUG_01101 [Clavispora lusitaniae ATCC 42720]OVF08224.1 putative peroxin [Clavispora lusitaniae]